MLAEILIVETDQNDDLFSSVIALAGEPRQIAKEIAELHADESRLCHLGDLKSYALISMFVLPNGRVTIR